MLTRFLLHDQLFPNSRPRIALVRGGSGSAVSSTQRSHIGGTRLDATAQNVDNEDVTSTSGHGDRSIKHGAPKQARNAQRHNIVETALTLMAQRGVDGTSMRELAGATGLNVASLYHYFPSKRDLLVEVLGSKGLIDALAAPTLSRRSQRSATPLADLLDAILEAMLEVEDFVRLMLGEALRGDETAFAVGAELFAETQEALERWIAEIAPDLCEEVGTTALAQMLRALLVGTFVEHLAGVLGESRGQDPTPLFRSRAERAATALGETAERS